MHLKEWHEVINVDFPKYTPITKNTIRAIFKNRRLFRGDMKICTGRIWTDEEFEALRKKILDTELP